MHREKAEAAAEWKRRRVAAAVRAAVGRVVAVRAVVSCYGPWSDLGCSGGNCCANP